AQRWLIQKENLRSVDQATRKFQPSAHTARVRLYQLVFKGCKFNKIQKLYCTFLGNCSWNSVQIRAQEHIFVTSQVLVGSVLLRNQAYRVSNLNVLFGNIATKYRRLPFRRS